MASAAMNAIARTVISTIQATGEPIRMTIGEASSSGVLIAAHNFRNRVRRSCISTYGWWGLLMCACGGSGGIGPASVAR